MLSKTSLQRMLILTAVMTIVPSTAVAQGGREEYDFKAAFLYQFGQFVTWPGGAVPGDSFVIGVLGGNPFGGELNRVAATKTIQKKRIVVQQFNSAKDYKPCHILFVSALSAESSEEKTMAERFKAALEKAKGSPALVVSDARGYAQAGAAISFFLEGTTLKLEINPDAAKRAGLSVSSRLLGLSIVKVVKDQPAPR